MTAQEDLARRIERDTVCRAVQKKIDEGKADFTDTARYTDRAAELLGEVLAAYVPDMPPDERETLCKALLRQRYLDTNAMLNAVQRALDAAQGLHLAPQIADYPEDRVEQAAHSLADETVPMETIVRRAKSAPATIARSFHDDYIEKNAAFRDSAGLKCYITRNAAAKCCEWCTKMAGRYRYGEEPEDVYRRHDNCSCTVTYENGRQRQDVWSKRTWEAPDKDAGAEKPTVFSQEQAVAVGAGEPTRLTIEQLSAVGLTKQQRRDMIRAAEQRKRDADSARFIFNTMTSEQSSEIIQRGIHEADAVYSYDTKENHFPSYARRIPKEPNTFDVISHGTFESMDFFPQDYQKKGIRSQIDAFILAQILNGREDFQEFLSDCKERGVKPIIRLLSCDTGNTENTGNCFAQLLANELGKTVSAPTKKIYVNPDGTFYIGKRKDGKMKTFTSRN